MNNCSPLTRSLRLAGLLALLLTAGTAWAQGTTFTYQGRLLQGGTPASGLFDFQLRGFDDATGGSQLGFVSTHINVTVDRGQLQLLVDFGPGVFVGDPLWIEISMRPAGSGPYDTLSPRQLVTPAPLAINADTVDGLDSTELQGQTGPAGPPGPVGAPGIDGIDGTAVLHGAGAPAGGIGIDGDFYVDTTSTSLWGPRVGGSWAGTGPVAMVGPTGPQGPEGAIGPAGDPGPSGPTGAPGPAGAPGAQGPPGLDGRTVLSGVGTPGEGNGADGDFYIDTTGPALWGPKSAGTWVGAGPTSMIGPSGSPGGGTNRVLRWNVFSTYDQLGGWMTGNLASLFGGIAPSDWTDNNALAGQMSADKDVLRTLLTRKAYPGNNALIYSETWAYYSETNGRVVVLLARILNSTPDPINWPVRFHHTCYGVWGEMVSVAINGVQRWSNDACIWRSYADLHLMIPANRVSSVIFVSTSNAPGPTGQTRSTLMAFSNNTFLMPAGLELVDDLETATGGWDQ